MPKQKTNSGSKKRFRRTASGFKHKQKGLRHILTKRRTKVKRKLRPQNQVSQSDIKAVKRLMPCA